MSRSTSFYFYLSNRLLMRIDDSSMRLQMFASCLEHSKGLFLPAGIVSREESGRNIRSLGVTDEQLQPLRAICLRRIKDWAADGSLIKHHALSSMLFCWQRWDASSEWKEWVLSQITTKDGLFAICFSMMGHSYSHDKVSAFVQIDALQKLVDLDLFKTRFLNIDKSQLTDQEIKKVDLFFRSLNSQRKQDHNEQTE